VFFLLWGVVHVAIGAWAAQIFSTRGPSGIYTFALSGVDPKLLSKPDVWITATLSNYFALVALAGIVATVLALTTLGGGAHARFAFSINALNVGLAEASYFWFVILGGTNKLEEGLPSTAMATIAIALGVLGFYVIGLSSPVETKKKK